MEICLLLLAIAFFGLSTFFYSYSLERFDGSLGLGLSSYPYRFYAIALVGFGSVLMLTATVSFSRHSKNLRRKSYQIQFKNKLIKIQTISPNIMAMSKPIVTNINIGNPGVDHT